MIKDACLIGNNIINTGKECDTSMVATAMLIAVPPDFSFTLEDIESDPVEWITPFLHAPIGQRVYPFFGLKAPINNITNSAGSDTIVTLDDGTPVFLRYALYTKTFETIAGGLCYAKVLQGLNKSGYNIIEIDQTGQMLVGVNSDGTLRGLITNFMYSPAPKQADLKTNPYLNQFQLSYSPIELVQNGKILSGASPLLQLMGLIDSEIVDAGTSFVVNSATAPTRTITITDQGTTGDTINIPGQPSISTITGGPVAVTGAETTPALLAAKINSAINAATGSNGGYTSTVLSDVITITGPTSLGDSVNGIDTAPAIVGDITVTHTAWADGEDASGKLAFKVKTECAKNDITSKFATSGPNSFVVTQKSNGAAADPISLAIVSGNVELTGPYSTGVVYRVRGAVPSVWLTYTVEGYDAEDYFVDITMP